MTGAARHRAQPRVGTARARAAASLDRSSLPKLFLASAGPLLVLYLLTASWNGTGSIDTYTNVITAHTLATEHSLILRDEEALTNEAYSGISAWVIESDVGPVSQYPPGAALHAVPFYLLWPGTSTTVTGYAIEDPDAAPVTIDIPDTGPAAIASALVTALAMGFLCITFRQLTTGSMAVAATFAAGVGTSAWTVAADELWQHGPAMLWIAAGGFALARSRTAPAAAAYALAIAVRPLTAIIALAPTAAAAAARRFSTTVVLGVGVAIGLGVIVGYNAEVFGTPSLSGGYGPDDGSTLLRPDLAWIVANVAKGLAHPTYGLLVWSPFLALLAPGLPTAWRAAPPWVRSPAIGGLAYLGLHWVVHRASGGIGYLYYRYPLEPLVAAAPLLLLSYLEWTRERPRMARATHIAVGLAIVGHGIAAMR